VGHTHSECNGDGDGDGDSSNPLCEGRFKHCCPRVVLASVLNPQFGSRSGMELNRNWSYRFYPINKLNLTDPAVFRPVPHFCKLRTLAPIK